MTTTIACTRARRAPAAGVVVLAGLLLGGGTAAAQLRQPTLGCTASDHSMTLELALPLKSDGGSDQRGLDGRLDIHHQKLPHDRRQWSLARRQPTHFWLHANELKLRLVLAAGEALVDVVIETVRRSPLDADYSGSITLRTAEGVRLTGRVTCGTDGL